MFAAHHQRAAELEHQPCPGPGFVSRLERGSQPADPLGTTQGDLQAPEVRQQLRPPRAGWRLLKAAQEMASGELGVAFGGRHACSVVQGLGDPRVLLPRSIEQVHGDEGELDVLLGEDPGCAQVPTLALGRGDVLVHRPGDQRVGEIQDLSRGEKVRCDEPVERPRGVVGVELGEEPGVAQGGPGPEDRGRPCEGERLRTQGLEPYADTLDHSRGSRAHHSLGVDPLAEHLGVAQLAQQLPDVKRVSAGQLGTGRLHAVDLLAHETGVHEALDPLGGQRVKLDHIGLRGGRHAVERAGGGSAGPRTSCDQHRARDLREPPGQVSQELHRRFIGPVRVIEQDQRRSPFADVRHKPGEGVGTSRDQRRVGVAEGLCRGRSEQLGCLLARLREHPVPRGGGEPLEGGGEQLSRRHPGQRTAQVGALRAEHLEALLPGDLLARRNQAGLADARRALEQQQPAVPVSGSGDGVRDERQLPVALEQQGIALQDLKRGRDAPPPWRASVKEMLWVWGFP